MADQGGGRVSSGFATTADGGSAFARLPAAHPAHRRLTSVVASVALLLGLTSTTGGVARAATAGAPAPASAAAGLPAAAAPRDLDPAAGARVLLLARAEAAR